ncbi:MAG: phage head spike fiber domain-containing protein [Dolichospermum sp.]
MIIGIGVGINRQRYMGSFSGAYQSRVTADGAIVESISCVGDASSLLQSASLLIIPSGYKGGKAYAEIPTNGNGDLTWTRASDAWRTNADGLIQRVPWNLLSNTNTFSSWNLEGGALTSGFTDPEGELTAYKYVQTTGGLYSGSSTATSGNKTASIWLKSVSGTSIACSLNDGGSGNSTTLTVTGTWQLFTFTYTTSTSRPSLYIYSISNASGIYVWHPQLVEGSSAQTYFPTTDRLNVPRLSYMYGSCPALLLEPQRTNLALYSEDFTNGWSLEGATISSNTNTAPDGNTTADRISESAITDVHRIYRSAYVVTSGTTYTYSLFVLKGTSRYCRLSFNQSSSASIWAAAQFDLDTLTFTSGVGSGGGTFSGATISQLPNSSWIRITISASLATTSAFAFFALSNGTAISSSDSRGCNSYLGSTSNNLIIWGAQLEQGAYATTIIPTTTASATRIADSFSRNNIYTNGLITSSGGTWFVELRNNISYTRDAVSEGLFIDTASGGFGTGFTLRNPGGGASRLAITKVISGVLTILYIPTTDIVKVAIKWNGTTADVFVNGTKQVSASAFTPTNMEFLRGAATDVPKFIQSMALYPTPLSDTDCTTLTTL